MNKLPVSLTAIGVIPFVLLSIAVPAGAFEDKKPVIELLLAYASIIISFLGGVHWGLAVTQYSNNRKVANMLIIESVIPILVAWGILMYRDIHVELLVLTLLYAFMWAIDSLLYSNNILPQWFFAIRCIVTPIVVVSLYVAYFGLI